MRLWLLLAPLVMQAQNPASVWITAPDSRIIAGASSQLTVLARDSAGRPLPNAICSWSTAGPGPFAVNSSGMVIANSLGIGDIAASCGNTRNTIRLQSIPSAITVTPSDKQINVGDTVSYSAQALDVNGKPVPNTPLTWNVIGEDGNGTVSALIAGDGTLTSVGVGRFTVRAMFSYLSPPNGQPNAGQGQFIPQVYGRARLTISPPKTYKLSRLASTGDRRDSFQLRPRRGQLAVSSSGQLAYNLSLEGLGTGLFLHDGQPHLLAAAGGSGNVPGTMMWDFDEPAINTYGEVFADISYWGIGTGLVWIFPGAPPNYLLQDGSTSYDIRNIFASRTSLNDSGQAIFRASLQSPDGKSRRNGLFSITRDGVVGLLLDSSQTLPGLPDGWAFTNEFAIDNSLNVTFSINSGGVQTVYYLNSNGSLRRVMGPGDQIEGRTVRHVRSPILSPGNSDLGMIVEFTSGQPRLMLCSQADCSKARTYDSNDLRAIYMIGDGSQVVAYANASIVVWDGTSAPRTIFQEGRLAPNGAVYSQFQSAGITSSGDVIAHARASTNLFLIVRASGNQRTMVASAGSFIRANAGPAFANLALGAKTGPAHLLMGGNRNNIFEASQSGMVPTLLAGDRLPSGGWFEANYQVRKLPGGELFVGTDDTLQLASGDSIKVLQSYPILMDGVNTFSAFMFAGNSGGLIATLHNTNSSIQRMMMMRDGDPQHIAWVGSGNPAYRTSSPGGGNFDGVNDVWVTDDGLIYVNMRVNGGSNGAFLYDGSKWTAIALVGDTIDGRALQSVNDIRVGGNHIFARMQLANRIGIYEYTGGKWQPVIAQSDDAPTGNIINGVSAFDANRSGEIAVAINSGAASQLVFVSGGKVRVVQDFNQAIPETGEWLRDASAVDLRDDGRIFFTSRNYNDQFNLYEADPLF